MNQTEKKITKRRLIFAGLTFLTILAVLYILVRRYQLSWQELISFTPENKIAAALVFQGFYALKSLTVFFPLPVLQLAVGHLFSLSWALVVNFCGIIVATTCPYLLGWHRGEKYVTSLVSQFDAVEKIKSLQSDNVVFSTYIIRMLQLPLDLVSLFLGSEHVNYPQYMLGNLLGLAPVTIAVTVMGETMTDITSPQFRRAVLFMAVVIVGSLLIFWYYTRHRRGHSAAEK